MVTLTSSNPSAAQAPTNATVTEGRTTANFTVTMSDIGTGAVVTISASTATRP